MAHIEADQILALAHTIVEALPTLAEPSAEVLARAQSFIGLIENPDVMAVLLKLEHHSMNTIELQLAYGNRDDLPVVQEESVILRVSRETIEQIKQPHSDLLGKKTVVLNNHHDIPYTFPHHDNGQISHALMNWVKQQYRFTYEVKGIYEQAALVRIALERNLGTAKSLARSHGSRIDAMYKKLYEYVVQASGIKPEGASADASADGKKAEGI